MQTIGIFLKKSRYYNKVVWRYIGTGIKETIRFINIAWSAVKRWYDKHEETILKTIAITWMIIRIIAGVIFICFINFCVVTKFFLSVKTKSSQD